MTLNHQSWSVVVLNSSRGVCLFEREREVLTCCKLEADANGQSKKGVYVGAAIAAAVAEAEVPVTQIDYYCSDTTAYVSSLKLPLMKGGRGGEGGAYAHLWSSFRDQVET